MAEDSKFFQKNARLETYIPPGTGRIKSPSKGRIQVSNNQSPPFPRNMLSLITCSAYASRHEIKKIFQSSTTYCIREEIKILFRSCIIPPTSSYWRNMLTGKLCCTQTVAGKTVAIDTTKPSIINKKKTLAHFVPCSGVGELSQSSMHLVQDLSYSADRMSRKTSFKVSQS